MSGAGTAGDPARARGIFARAGLCEIRWTCRSLAWGPCRSCVPRPLLRRPSFRVPRLARGQVAPDPVEGPGEPRGVRADPDPWQRSRWLALTVGLLIPGEVEGR